MLSSFVCVSMSMKSVGGSVIFKSVSCGVCVNLTCVGGGFVGPLVEGLNPKFWVLPILVGGGLRPGSITSDNRSSP